MSCVPCPYLSAGSGGEYAEVPTSPRDSAAESSSLNNAHVAAGKAISFLMKVEQTGYLGVEKGSVYGAAIAIPQIARSVGWSATMTGLAMRSYIFLAFNVFVQTFLISVMNEEAHIMNPFAGKMHLCDFGASISSCPDGANCRGPGGTIYTYTRLYGFSAWSTRAFVRDALKALFPERTEDVDAAADPGEYGVEDYYCRLVCCLIFMMGVVDDLWSSIGLASLLYHLPVAEESWIRYEVPDWMEKEQAKKIHNWSELDLVRFRVAGMPLVWKLVNLSCVFLPKVYIWWTLVSTGFHFLMETAGIVDLVVNCMALSFVLSIDEMIFSRLATMASKHMMCNLEDLALFDTHVEEHETEEEVVSRYDREEFGRKKWKILLLVLPRRLMAISALMAFFICKYYYNNCQWQGDGSWISKPIFMPESVTYNPLSFIHGLFLDASVVPLWEMPSED